MNGWSSNLYDQSRTVNSCRIVHLQHCGALVSCIISCVPFVRCGSTTEVQRGPRNVRFRGYSGSRFWATECLLVATSGHCRMSSVATSHSARPALRSLLAYAGCLVKTGASSIGLALGKSLKSTSSPARFKGPTTWRARSRASSSCSTSRCWRAASTSRRAEPWRSPCPWGRWRRTP